MGFCSTHIPVPSPFSNFQSSLLKHLPSPQQPPSSGKPVPSLSTSWEAPSAAQGYNQPWAQTFPAPNTHLVPQKPPQGGEARRGQAYQHPSPGSTPEEEGSKA